MEKLAKFRKLLEEMKFVYLVTLNYDSIMSGIFPQSIQNHFCMQPIGCCVECCNSIGSAFLAKNGGDFLCEYPLHRLVNRDVAT